MVRRVDRKEEILIWCRECTVREAKNGTEIDELLQARASGHKRVWQNVQTDPGPEGWQGSGWKIEGQKKEPREKSVRGF